MSNRKPAMQFEIVEWACPSPSWAWHLRSRNGRVVAESAVRYTRKDDCVKAAQNVRDTLGPGSAPILCKGVPK